MVGSGPQEREARRYVATRGLQGVEFLGRVSDAEKAQLFRTADVYASPATGGESFGIVLLEAMAAGTPIVASDIHGYKGVVRRGREGLLVPPREPKELAVAIAELLDDPELREQMGAAGQARAEEFSWPRVTGQGRGLLRLRHPPAGRERHAARRTSGAAIPQAPPRPGEALRIVRAAAGPGPRPLAIRERQPPDRRRVGHHQARHGRWRSVRMASIGREQRRIERSGRRC